MSSWLMTSGGKRRNTRPWVRLQTKPRASSAFQTASPGKVSSMPIMSSEATTPDGWYHYAGEISPSEAGRFGFTVRILPHHPLLLDSHSLGLIRWAQPA